MSEVQGICVPPDLVSKLWDSVSPLINSALGASGLTTLTEVERELLAGHMLLWIATDGTKIEAVAVTQLSMVENRCGAMIKTGTIVACGGKGIDRFSHMIRQLHDYFREEGCARSRIIGRPGWVRFYPDYKLRSVILEKEL